MTSSATTTTPTMITIPLNSINSSNSIIKNQNQNQNQNQNEKIKLSSNSSSSNLNLNLNLNKLKSNINSNSSSNSSLSSTSSNSSLSSSSSSSSSNSSPSLIISLNSKSLISKKNQFNNHLNKFLNKNNKINYHHQQQKIINNNNTNFINQNFYFKEKFKILNSFLGFFDIKLGVTIIGLISLLNKAVGFYGILALFNGANLTQISMYIYSILTIILVIYGLQATGEENPRKTLIFSHSLLLDHLLSTIYTIHFGLQWFLINPHDGRRVAHGDAQKNIMNSDLPQLSPESRKQAAQAIWKAERGVAAVILILIWLAKLYFILVVYSFALHLRRGTYTTLPLSRPPSSISTANRLRNVTRGLHRTPSGYAYNRINNSNIPLSDAPLFLVPMDDDQAKLNGDLCRSRDSSSPYRS